MCVCVRVYVWVHFIYFYVSFSLSILLSIAAVQIAKALGCTVIGTVGADAKMAVARDAGCDAVINYATTPDWAKQVMDLTKKKGAGK